MSGEVKVPSLPAGPTLPGPSFPELTCPPRSLPALRTQVLVLPSPLGLRIGQELLQTLLAQPPRRPTDPQVNGRKAAWKYGDVETASRVAFPGGARIQDADLKSFYVGNVTVPQSPGSITLS